MEIVINREDNESFTHFISKKTSSISQKDFIIKQIQYNQQTNQNINQSKDLDKKIESKNIESSSLKQSRSFNENMFSQQFNLSAHENEKVKPQNQDKKSNSKQHANDKREQLKQIIMISNKSYKENKRNQVHSKVHNLHRLSPLKSLIEQQQQKLKDLQNKDIIQQQISNIEQDSLNVDSYINNDYLSKGLLNMKIEEDQSKSSSYRNSQISNFYNDQNNNYQPVNKSKNKKIMKNSNFVKQQNILNSIIKIDNQKKTVSQNIQKMQQKQSGDTSLLTDSNNETHKKKITQFISISEDHLNVSSKFLPELDDVKLNTLPEKVLKQNISKNSQSIRKIPSIQSNFKSNMDIASSLEQTHVNQNVLKQLKLTDILGLNKSSLEGEKVQSQFKLKDYGNEKQEAIKTINSSKIGILPLKEFVPINLDSERSNTHSFLEIFNQNRITPWDKLNTFQIFPRQQKKTQQQLQINIQVKQNNQMIVQEDQIQNSQDHKSISLKELNLNIESKLSNNKNTIHLFDSNQYPNTFQNITNQEQSKDSKILLQIKSLPRLRAIKSMKKNIESIRKQKMKINQDDLEQNTFEQKGQKIELKNKKKKELADDINNKESSPKILISNICQTINNKTVNSGFIQNNKYLSSNRNSKLYLNNSNKQQSLMPSQLNQIIIKKYEQLQNQQQSSVNLQTETNRKFILPSIMNIQNSMENQKLNDDINKQDFSFSKQEYHTKESVQSLQNTSIQSLQQNHFSTIIQNHQVFKDTVQSLEFFKNQDNSKARKNTKMKKIGFQMFQMAQISIPVDLDFKKIYENQLIESTFNQSLDKLNKINSEKQCLHHHKMMKGKNLNHQKMRNQILRNNEGARNQKDEKNQLIRNSELKIKHQIQNSVLVEHLSQYPSQKLVNIKLDGNIEIPNIQNEKVEDTYLILQEKKENGFGDEDKKIVLFRKDKNEMVQDEEQSTYKYHNMLSSHHHTNFDPINSSKIFTGTFQQSKFNGNQSKYISENGNQINQNKKNIFNSTSSYIIK